MLQRVVVLESGFAWNGVTYESLSKVARAITGTNWNGPRFAVLAPRNIANRAKLVLLMSVAPIAISQGLAAYRLPAPIKRWGSVQPVRSMIPPLPYCRSLTGRAPRRWASASRLHRAHQSRSKLMGLSNRRPFCKWILQILEAILFRSRPHRQDFGGFVRAYHGSDQHGHAQRGYRGARGRQDHDLGCAWLQFGLGYHRRGSTELAPSARASSFSLHAFSFFLGQALGPMVYGVVLPTIGATISLSLGATLLAATGLVASLALRPLPGGRRAGNSSLV